MTFVVPLEELDIRATRAGGPGGQHVNTASTRIEVRWSVSESPSLTPDQRERLTAKLAHRLDTRGVLRVVASRRRSQLQNREAAIERLNVVVTEALREAKPRKRTKIPSAAREKRLGEKRQRSEIKRHRGPVSPDD